VVNLCSEQQSNWYECNHVQPYRCIQLNSSSRSFTDLLTKYPSLFLIIFMSCPFHFPLFTYFYCRQLIWL
jgi:hypothetical protein